MTIHDYSLDAKVAKLERLVKQLADVVAVLVDRDTATAKDKEECLATN